MLALFLLDALLVAASFLPEKFTLNLPVAGEVNIGFPQISQITDFSYLNFSEEDINDRIDELMGIGPSAYHLQRENLSGLKPSKTNEFLLNPETNDTSLLDNFFKALLEQKNSDVVRIAHYGDSQIEGDRITCHIRTAFQQKFGGSGVGYVPFEDIADNANYFRSNTPNWIRYTVFHNRTGNSYYGLSGSVFKFSRYTVKKEEKDSLSAADTDTAAAETTVEWKSAILGITLYQYVTYSKAKLMYGRTTGACNMIAYNKTTGEKLYSDTLPSAEGFSILDLKFPSPVKSFRLEFSGATPDFYGLLIDGANGIQVDNYAIRGHSGDGLLLINPEYLATQLKKLNTKLVILQYGNNVVPYVNSEAKLAALQETYSALFARFKKVAPDISVLVVGVSDMATTVNGSLETYPYLTKIRDMQKKAALDAGCAFYDLYEVMGGKNSVQVWKKKGLATTDGHFSNKGQKLIGEELFKAILTEYNQYVYRNKKKKGTTD